MGENIRIHLAVATAILFAFLGNVFAVEYPWLNDANTQVLVLRDPHVDFALRLAAIDRATSIDCISFVQGTDATFGMPMLQAFRRAAARGVPSRHLYGKLGTFVGGTGDQIRAMLADTQLKLPAKLIIFGGLRSLLTRFHPLDMPHEKILILNMGTKDELIWIGGRNNWRATGTDLDLGMVLRRIHADRPYVGDQIREAFEGTWSPAAQTFPPYAPSPGKAKLIPRSDENAAIALNTPAQQAQFAMINDFLQKPVADTASYEDYEARPQRMRVMTNDLLGRVLTGIYKKSLRGRKNIMSDNVEGTAPYVAGAKLVYICAMSVFMPAELKEAVKTALRGGAEVHLLTNSRDAHRNQVPMGLPYLLSLEDITDLMALGGKLHVHVLDVALLRAHEQSYPLVNYMHRKLIVADNHVFFGSDNWNDMSRARNSEMVVQAEDARLSQLVRNIVDEDLKVFTRLSCEKALTDKKSYGYVQRGLNWLFLPLY
ncbi:MAG: phosphatidylserine/phosphatidylglycerophosphate/cardiolipin synthase family protein [Deltaproteobacteria bacterium]|nr:phosphatidylserine/phosphatidylglycerophosphate/cardiolipin synthase family protein [Deltaproteobacteria bacterium]